MTSMHKLLLVASLMLGLVIGATLAFGNDQIKACPQPDGTVMYTNKDVKGCTIIVGPELSVVPDRKATFTFKTQESDMLPEVPAITPTVGRFQAGQPGAILSETCTLWKEWMDLNRRTAGGFEGMGVEENKRRFLLSRIFGNMGFSPYGCQ